jgi:hypothetical protein
VIYNKFREISLTSEASFTANVIFHFIFTVHLFIIELTNALRQFFHCFLYYKDAPICISAVILPSSGGILSEFLHTPILWLRHNSESVFVTTSYKICKISGIVKLLKVIKFLKIIKVTIKSSSMLYYPL